jgi:Rod binding domain-containing protein
MSIDAISTASLPADVRVAGTGAQKNYKSALAFEQMLVGELVKEMIPKDSEMSQGPYASTMQDTLSTALVGGQGLGLARQLYKEMQSS